MIVFLNFKKMITPAIVRILFFLAVIACVFFGVVAIISGIKGPHRGGMEIFIGLIITIMGPIMIRIACKIIIVIFSIHDNLIETKNLLNKAV
jgi:hypothetical protein